MTDRLIVLGGLDLESRRLFIASASGEIDKIEGRIELDCSQIEALDGPTLGMLVTVARATRNGAGSGSCSTSRATAYGVSSTRPAWPQCSTDRRYERAQPPRARPRRRLRRGAPRGGGRGRRRAPAARTRPGAAAAGTTDAASCRRSRRSRLRRSTGRRNGSTPRNPPRSGLRARARPADRPGRRGRSPAALSGRVVKTLPPRTRGRAASGKAGAGGRAAGERHRRVVASARSASMRPARSSYIELDALDAPDTSPAWARAHAASR